MSSLVCGGGSGVCPFVLLCPTLCDPMDCSTPGTSVHGISQARIPEWVAISSSRGSSPLRDWTSVSWIGRWILYQRATWEAPSSLITNGKLFYIVIYKVASLPGVDEISGCPQYHLALSISSTSAILVSLEWYHTVVFIFIPWWLKGLSIFCVCLFGP